MKPSALIIKDNPDDVRLLEFQIAPNGWNYEWVNNLPAGGALARRTVTMKRLSALMIACLLAGCGAHSPTGQAWYKPSAFTVGLTAPGLISSPPVHTKGGGPRNGPLDTVGAIATLTFPLFPVPTKPQGPYGAPVAAASPAPVVTPKP